MKDAYYFPHDSNATDDPKIAALISKYGFLGYGWFWRLIELLRDQPGYKYPMNKYTFDALAMQLQCDRNAVHEFINDCCHEFATIDGALLSADDNFLWSESLIRRMKVFDDVRENARKAAKKRWECESNAGAMQTQCGSNASKVNKSKVNNIYTDEFELFWKEYPNKKEKLATFKCWNTRLKEGFSPEVLIKAAINYAKEQKGKEIKYIKHGTTFLGPSKPFEDYLDENKPNPSFKSSIDKYRR